MTHIALLHPTGACKSVVSVLEGAGFPLFGVINALTSLAQIKFPDWGKSDSADGAGGLLDDGVWFCGAF